LVLAEFDGEKLLGKAREIADSMGFRVLALCSSERGADFAQKLISLGADEVISYSNLTDVFEWSKAVSSLLNANREIRFVFAISGIINDAILGRVYASLSNRVNSFATRIDSINEIEATKNLRTWGASLHFRISGEEDKVSLFSFKPFSIPYPFEDPSRPGKVTEVEFKSEASAKKSPKTAGLEKECFSDSGSILTILVGKAVARGRAQLEAAQRIASKYYGTLLTTDEKVQDVYAPCLAIKIEDRRAKDLPRFHEELISVTDSEGQVISTVADTSIVAVNITDILRDL
jgi:electron transfer flavoprotein alpha subunit